MYVLLGDIDFSQSNSIQSMFKIYEPNRCPSSVVQPEITDLCAAALSSETLRENERQSTYKRYLRLPTNNLSIQNIAV